MRRTVLLLLALLAVSCSGSKPSAAPETTVTTETTLPPSTTTSSTSKPTTTSSTTPRTTVTTVLSVGPGEATLSGTVTGPQGPVDGAIVRVERVVGKSAATQDVTTAGGGSWQLPSILGGAYRVRALKPPELAQSPVESFFLAARERKTVDFKLVAAGGDRIIASVNPSPPRLGQAATLTVTVGTGKVDDQGRPSLTPRPGVPLTLTGGQGYVVESSPQAVTDGNGAAAWTVRCTVEGATSLPLTVGTGLTSVNLAACGAAPPPAPPTTTKSG